MSQCESPFPIFIVKGACLTGRFAAVIFDSLMASFFAPISGFLTVWELVSYLCDQRVDILVLVGLWNTISRFNL